MTKKAVTNQIRMFSLSLCMLQLLACSVVSGEGMPQANTLPDLTVISKPIVFDQRRRGLSVQYLRDRHGLNQADATITPKMVVVHWTGIPTFDDTFAVFDPVELPSARHAIGSASALNVSSQYLIDRDGTIYQLLPDTLFARHVIGLNYCAIGIENVGNGSDFPLTDAQLESNIALIRQLYGKHDIDYVIGHYEYSQFIGHPLWKEADPDYLTEKTDPGIDFMAKLRAGLADLEIKAVPDREKAAGPNLIDERNDELRVDGARLNDSMDKMQTFGTSPSGGSDRVAYSTANREAYEYLDTLMSSAGLATRIDAAGNLIGRREGRNKKLAAIVSGSHIDTVPDGGHYDGIVGVMAAIEVARTLYDMRFPMDHALEIAVWSNEEGGKTGSRAINGSITEKDVDRPSLGKKSIRDGIRFLGGDPENLPVIVRENGDIAGYVELHVEQGAILDKANVAIGIVDGIVGIKRWNVTVRGFANHAGTTPMDQRQDALLVAAQFITTVRQIITAEPGRQVGTVGRIQAFPGAPNVVPGTVTLSLEIRDLDMQKIDVLFGRIEAAAGLLADKTATTFEFDQFYLSPAAITDNRISALIESSANALGLGAAHLPSGAGHDAQSVATIAPIGMIFVPSSNGISHAPGEFTSAQQITDGANVLLQTIIRIDEAFP